MIRIMWLNYLTYYIAANVNNMKFGCLKIAMPLSKLEGII